MKFTLREWRKGDEEAVFYHCNNRKLAENLRNIFPYPYTFADAQWYVDDSIKLDREKELRLCIDVGDRAAGSISVVRLNDVYEKSAEIGYWLGEAFWGNGIMTEAVKQICRIAFEQYDIVRIHAAVFAPNLGSRRVLEKAGFEMEGTCRRSIYKNGKYMDSCVYALVKEEKGKWI